MKNIDNLIQMILLYNSNVYAPLWYVRVEW